MPATTSRPAQRRSRRPFRHLAIALGGALLVAGGVAAGPVGAQSPTAVKGDHHSPAVVRLADSALKAKRVYQRTNASADREAYMEALAAVAEVTASEIGVSPQRMSSAWAAADDQHQTAVLSALTQLGVEYRSATSEPGVGFDCSGLMFYAWGEAGFTLTHQSGSQISEAEARAMDTAMAGDLAQYPGHVMMYLGVPRTFVHSSNPENDVELWMTSEDRAAGLNYGDPSE